MAAYTTINKPSLHFNPKTYTGGSGNTAHTGVGFQPDLVWIKERTRTRNHAWFDVIRGATKIISSNVAGAGHTVSDSLTSFDSDGFTLGADSSNYVGGSSTNTVSWNWKANGTGSSNSDGSISSTVSVNTTAGFSIVSYTGTGSNATIGHGLGAVPKMIFFKDRETSVDWGVYAEPNGNTKEMYLSTTDAAGTNSGAFNNTTPTSSVFTIGTSSRYNPSSKGVIAYCFANVKGYSKIGSYTGNGLSNGPFVYTGFRVAWLMIKRTDSANSWIIMDTKRNTFNPMGEELKAEVSDAGNDATRWDQLSNGFKLRNSGGAVNASGGTYIYMAFAGAPFVTSGTKAAGTAR